MSNDLVAKALLGVLTVVVFGFGLAAIWSINT